MYHAGTHSPLEVGFLLAKRDSVGVAVINYVDCTTENKGSTIKGIDNCKKSIAA